MARSRSARPAYALAGNARVATSARDARESARASGLSDATATISTPSRP